MIATLLLALPALALAQAPAAPAPAAGKAAEATVDQFRQALTEGYQDKVIELLLPDVLVFETGYAERGRDQYLARHFKDDSAFAAATTRKLLRRESWQEGGVAGVVSLFEIRGAFGDRKVALEQTETAILRQTPEGWRIAHLHWSAHSLAQ